MMLEATHLAIEECFFQRWFKHCIWGAQVISKMVAKLCTMINQLEAAKAYRIHLDASGEEVKQKREETIKPAM